MTLNFFAELPTDVLILILAFLSATDLLNLRKVCKLVHSITRERSVWVNALRSASREHDVYGPAFSLAGMSNAELEGAATACARFSRRLRRAFAATDLPPRPVAPYSVRTIVSPSGGEEFENLRFVPGGRFILSSHQHILRVWDAGTFKRTSTSTLLASYEFPSGGYLRSVRTRASPFSEEEALVLATSVVKERYFHIHMIRMKPTATGIELVPLCDDLVLPMTSIEPPTFLGSTSRHIAVATDTAVVLWNFVQDTWISWAQHRTDWEDALYFCDKHIITVHADNSALSFSLMPTLKPRIEDAAPELTELPVTGRFDLQRDLNEDGLPNPERLHMCVCGMTLVFHGRESAPLYFDVVSELDANILISHYVIETGEGAELKMSKLGESAMHAAFRTSHTLHLEWLGCTIASGEGRPCIQSYVVDGSCLHVCLADLDLQAGRDGKPESKCIMGTLETPGLVLNELNVDVCSFTGRVCARVLGDRDGEYELTVMDYIGLEKT
uniref:F-box domain-containing protein n=1 Tax=Mycena chlorophos TaxID=658473 RepID=A0ABQ0LUE7_MYCCL|nr:predicted protein [Mycena chlorophos]